MATFKTQPHRGNGINPAKLAPVSMGTVEANALRIDLAPVNDDLTTGCIAGVTLTGPARSLSAGQRIIVSGWASAPGTLYVETSSDGGSTWPNSDSEAIVAAEYVTGSAAPVAGANRYRVRFVCGPVGASKVNFSTQARA